MFKKFLKRMLMVAATIIMVAPVLSGVASADGRSYGPDLSKYQGAYTNKPYARDQFAISQVGGYANGYFYDQWTYPTQISSGIANGLRMHTYIWYQVGGNAQLGKQVVDHFLPKIQAPKGSIIALDYEDGASWDKNANTEAILAGMREIKAAGYVPMYYSYKPYTLAHVDYNRIIAEFPNSGWIAAYPDYNVRTEPYWGVFPSLPGISIYQFTSTYRAGGLDGNISLAPNGRDITMSGYTNGNSQKPKTETPATEQGKQIHKDTHNYTVKPNDSWWAIANRYGMEMNALAQLNGKTINDVIHPGQVIRVADKGDGQSVSNKVNTTPAQPKPAQPSAQYYTVRYGDSFWSIANKYGMNMYTLAANNGLSINSVIYPGQRLKVSGNAQATQKVHYVKYGETLSGIAAQLGTTVSHLQAVNGIRNANYIWVGQRIAA
ncbi:endolysin (glycoside Hydrolase Family 25 protein) (plasmid) [Limosilactobacillus reuteri subsp. suis]|nr:endolysin (glycoside Hydrolase Family 25 protein) [Limosilactobacillus reuteri subsp. suis]